MSYPPPLIYEIGLPAATGTFPTPAKWQIEPVPAGFRPVVESDHNLGCKIYGPGFERISELAHGSAATNHTDDL